MINCGKNFPTRAYINGKSRDFTLRKYCLTCSPFKGKNNKQLEKERTDGLKTCSRCHLDFPREMFMRTSIKTGKIAIKEPHCTKCRTLYRLDKIRELKNNCVQYKGGKCKICSYSKNVHALSFHHKDPEQKDFEISKKRWYSSKVFEAIKKELDKCDLLCLNCPAETHSKLSITAPSPKEDY